MGDIMLNFVNNSGYHSKIQIVMFQKSQMEDNTDTAIAWRPQQIVYLQEADIMD